MDGIQILIYIVIAIVYFIIKGVNKAAKPEQPEQTGEFTDVPPVVGQPNVGSPRKTAPMTFEDLLEEVKESTRKPKKLTQEPKKDKRTRSFREIADEEDRVRKATQDARATEQKAYEEKERRRPKLYEEVTEEYVPRYKSEINQVDYEDSEKASYAGLDDRQKRFNAFNIPVDTPNLFAQLLKDPQGAKTAFIMAEIFKRKY